MMPLNDNTQKLLSLLADGEFHSGTLLAKQLDISRAAVCKYLNQLAKSLDLDIVAISGKGYRLTQALELLNHDTINSLLTQQSRSLISQLDIFWQIDSTNRYLVEQSRHSALSGRICLAEQQTAGKGRRGRTWVSPFGNNIYASIAWQFEQTGYTAIAGLSLAIGIAVIRTLHELGIEHAGLKWPNDIYVQGKKLGGILIEVSGETNGACTAIIGIGLNVFLSETKAQSITQAWTDMSRISHTLPSRNVLAAMLLNQVLAILSDFEHQGIAAYLNEWRHYDCLIGQSITLYIGEQAIFGTVMGIDDNGLLLLKRDNNNIQAFASGEVSFSESK